MGQFILYASIFVLFFVAPYRIIRCLSDGYVDMVTLEGFGSEAKKKLTFIQRLKFRLNLPIYDED